LPTENGKRPAKRANPPVAKFYQEQFSLGDGRWQIGRLQMGVGRKAGIASASKAKAEG